MDRSFQFFSRRSSSPKNSPLPVITLPEMFRGPPRLLHDALIDQQNCSSCFFNLVFPSARARFAFAKIPSDRLSFSHQELEKK